ncbi:hypothetical protein GCM10022226_65390 [Sphaerisporangium flaviroseum]|uniref:DUF4131 domain-containing protein n=1 Tax=Sphaerisporangium flaviroseum TaxID=509199 RepID=A0ABP7J507_9ACTN
MDGVRVSLAGLGFGLIVAGCLGTPLVLAKAFPLEQLTPGQRMGMIVIGLLTVLLMLGSRSLFRPLRLRTLTALLFSTLVGTVVVFVAGTLVFPALLGPVRPRPAPRGGEWKGFLEYPESGRHDVYVRIDALDHAHVVSGRLVIRLGNGKCVFLLRDSEITPGAAMSMDSGDRSPGDEVCEPENGAELRMEASGRPRAMKLAVVRREEIVAVGEVTRIP